LLWPELSGSEEWLDRALDGILKDATAGVYPDGVETEETSSYHWVATSQFLGLVQSARLAGRENNAKVQQLASIVEKMISYIAYSMDFTGMAPMNGDNNEEYYGSDVLGLAAPGQFNRSDWAYIATKGSQGTQPVGFPSKMFPWAGQFISRSGWGTGHGSSESVGRECQQLSMGKADKHRDSKVGTACSADHRDR